MNEKKFLNHVETKRQNVVKIVECDYVGNSQIILPAIFVDSVKETHEKFGIKMIVTLDSYCDLFLTGFDIGNRKGEEISKKLNF